MKYRIVQVKHTFVIWSDSDNEAQRMAVLSLIKKTLPGVNFVQREIITSHEFQLGELDAAEQEGI